MHIALNYKTKYYEIFSFKIPYITVLRLVYILAGSTRVLFSVLTQKQIIACSEVDDRLGSIQTGRVSVKMTAVNTTRWIWNTC